MDQWAKCLITTYTMFAKPANGVFLSEMSDLLYKCGVWMQFPDGCSKVVSTQRFPKVGNPLT